MADAQKQRGDAEIDQLFKNDEQRDEFYAASEKRRLAVTQTELARGLAGRVGPVVSARA